MDVIYVYDLVGKSMKT